MLTILLKKSDTPGSVPGTANLTNLAGGVEVAVNTADKRVYSMTSASAVIELGTNPSSLTCSDVSATVLRAGSATITNLLATTLTVSGGTANGVLYLNASKVATSGSALTFDGSALGVASASNNQLVLNAVSASTGTRITISRNGTANTYFGDAKSITGADIDATGLFTTGTNPLIFGIGSEAMRLTSTSLYTASGINVGIGTSSPTTKLTVYDATTPQVTFNNGTSTFIVGNNSGGNNKILYGTGAYPMIFYTNATEAMKIDASQNLGLGVTPSAYDAGIKAIDIGSGSAILNPNSTGQTWLLTNAYYGSAAFRYKNSGVEATRYDQASGSHAWYTAPSWDGTGSNTISFTQAMTLDADGRLMVGATSAAGANFFTVERNSTTLPCYANVTGGASETVIANLDPGALITLKNLNTTNNIYTAIRGTSTNGTTNNAIFFVRESNSTHAGSIAFGTTNSSGTFAERARITAGGYFKASNDGTYVSSTGTYHELRSTTNNSRTVSIHSAASNGTQYGLLISTANDQADATRYFLSCEGGGVERATIRSNGGLANYSANDVNLASDERLKDISPLNTAWDKVKDIEVVNYRYKDCNEGDPLLYGVIAQQVQPIVPELVVVTREAKEATEDQEATPEFYGIREQPMYWLAIKALQEAMARIEQLEADMAALKASA